MNVKLIINSRNKVYSAVNINWNLVKSIMQLHQCDEKSSYGDDVFEKLSQN